MNQLSGNIGGRIGALELSDAVSAMSDGALEDSAGYVYAGPSNSGPCPMLTSPQMCRRIDDSVLEDSVSALSVAPTHYRGCVSIGRIDDGALEEAAGAVYAGSTNKPEICSPPTWQMSGCRRIDDSALEVSGEMTLNPPTNWRNPMGQCV